MNPSLPQKNSFLTFQSKQVLFLLACMLSTTLALSMNSGVDSPSQNEKRYDSQMALKQPQSLSQDDSKDISKQKKDSSRDLEVKKVLIPLAFPQSMNVSTVSSKMIIETPVNETWTPESAATDEWLMNRLTNDFPESGYNSKEFHHIYSSCAKSKKWGASAKPLNHLQPFSYIYESSHICKGQVDLLIAVHTNPQRQERRRLIRSTWGALRQIGDQRIALVFFAAGGLNSTLQAIMNNESMKYGDIVQRDFVENYRNLTYKHLSIFEWILQNCNHAKYLLKVDDDTFVDPFHIIRFVALHQPSSFLCRVIQSAKPFRTKVSNLKKWNVSLKEYSDKTYPNYCEGFAYLLDVREVRNLYWCSMFTQFFWIDDVYVGGILADRLNLNREMYWHGHYFDWMRPSHASDMMLDFMVLSVKENVVFANTYHDIWRGVIQRQVSFL